MKVTPEYYEKNGKNKKLKINNLQITWYNLTLGAKVIPPVVDSITRGYLIPSY